MEERIRRSSGNVFKDAGFPPDPAAHLQIRTDLMLKIERVLKGQSLTQARAARVLGVTQPRVRDLVRGRIDRFSIDTLVDMLAKLSVGDTPNAPVSRGRMTSTALAARCRARRKAARV